MTGFELHPSIKMLMMRNADFFSFFVNLCQKDEYQLGGDAGEDTFLDAYLGEGFKDTESFTFAIRKGLGGQVILSSCDPLAHFPLYFPKKY